ncbi:MAG TPA: NAD(P)/FAD-dependent oxidoreductase [Firmicutes bacterium]|nr:NAD(P)/FAD-dependent oxidoreductase [Bacillota bacterium]
MRYIIVGNGVAGDSAAMAISETDNNSEILLFSEEAIPFYYRPRLIDVVSGEVTLNKIIIHNEEFYSKKNIKIFLNTKINKIDTDKKEIKTDSGKSFSFDKLLIATGGYSFIPPIPGTEKEGVFSLRDAEDSVKIIKYLNDVKETVVIGGGLLGLETANAFLKRGKKVSVVEFSDRLLPRQLDTEGADILKKNLESRSINFFLAEVTETIIGGNPLQGIKTKSGKEISAQLILISAGVRSTLDLVRNTPIKINRAIDVDSQLRTSVRDIYAAGDCAEVLGNVYGIYPPAKEQGRIAGLNMAGKTTEYSGTIPSHKLKVAGIDLCSIGKLDMDGILDCEKFVDKTNYIYKKAFIESGKIVGAMLLGDLKAVSEIEQAIVKNEEFSGIKKFFLS